MILLTGAAGKTGKAILNTLIPHGIRVRSLVRSEKQAEEVKKIGSTEVAISDLRDPDALSKAIKGVAKIYYICPNITPDEVEIGKTLVTLARQHEVKRFVYHSVMHPQIESMPHHWQKMRMEEVLFASGLDFTILQPCAYMQNIIASWQSITETSIYPVPYSASARISIVDLMDVAAAAEVVLTQLNHSNAIYELAGPEPLSQVEVAEGLSKEIGKPVVAEVIDRDEWAATSRRNGLNENQISTLVSMFEYYENYGLVGNPNILNYLIKRPATRFVDFVNRVVTSEKRGKNSLVDAADSDPRKTSNGK